LGRQGKQQLKFAPERSPRIAQMAARLQSDEGQAAYRKRKWIAEPPNGWIKSVLGFRQFSLGGSWSEIKEERAASGKAEDTRAMSHPRPGPGRAATFCRPRS